MSGCHSNLNRDGGFGLVCAFSLELKPVLSGVMPLIHHWDFALFLLVSLSLNFLFFHLDLAADAGCPLMCNALYPLQASECWQGQGWDFCYFLLSVRDFTSWQIPSLATLMASFDTCCCTRIQSSIILPGLLFTT